METARGFFESLFDMSFTSLVTSKIIRVLYALSLLASGVFGLALVAAGFDESAATGLVTLIVIAPLVFLALAIYFRVMLEIVIVIFRMAEHAAEIAEHTRTRAQ